MVLATASLFQNTEDTRVDALQTEPSRRGEPFYRAAEERLTSETGKVRLESVQARLTMCLYLLHTSRPNQAWYVFGTTVQFAMALGLHRSRSPAAPLLDAITTECRKRAFWAAFALDAYLSVILGRPSLIHSDDVDQQFPEAVDDENLTVDGIVANHLGKDSVNQASVFHAKITRIFKKAMKEQ